MWVSGDSLQGNDLSSTNTILSLCTSVTMLGEWICEHIPNGAVEPSSHESQFLQVVNLIASVCIAGFLPL